MKDIILYKNLIYYISLLLTSDSKKVLNLIYVILAIIAVYDEKGYDLVIDSIRYNKNVFRRKKKYGTIVDKFANDQDPNIRTNILMLVNTLCTPTNPKTINPKISFEKLKFSMYVDAAYDQTTSEQLQIQIEAYLDEQTEIDSELDEDIEELDLDTYLLSPKLNKSFKKNPGQKFLDDSKLLNPLKDAIEKKEDPKKEEIKSIIIEPQKKEESIILEKKEDQKEISIKEIKKEDEKEIPKSIEEPKIISNIQEIKKEEKKEIPKSIDEIKEELKEPKIDVPNVPKLEEIVQPAKLPGPPGINGPPGMKGPPGPPGMKGLGGNLNLPKLNKTPITDVNLKAIRVDKIPMLKYGETIFKKMNITEHSAKIAETIDLDSIKKFFNAKTKVEQKKSEDVPIAGIVDGKRNQNVLLSLGSLKQNKVPLERLKEVILTLDETAIKSNTIFILESAMPTEKEQAAIIGYNGTAPFNETEKFFKDLSDIPKLAERMRAWKSKILLEDQVKYFKSKLQIVNHACLIFKENKKWQRILSTMLAYYNIINGKDENSLSYGFKLEETLSSFPGVMTTDGTTTLMRLMLLGIVKNDTDLLSFKKEVYSILDDASKVAFLETRMGKIKKQKKKNL